MSEMVERVARALHEARHKYLADKYPTTHGKELPWEDLGRLGGTGHEIYKAMARAAIEEMERKSGYPISDAQFLKDAKSNVKEIEP